MFKKIISILILAFFLGSCGDTLSSVKRGITGEKAQSTDEFLIEKKDPLILPPDFENLPSPDESETSSAEQELSIFEIDLETSIEDAAEPSTSTEESILRKIQSQ